MKSRDDQYWREYLRSLAVGGDTPTHYLEAFTFGFTPEDATELSALVLEGVKTATGSVLWSLEADEKPIPQIGDHSIVQDGDGRPVCIIRTIDVSILPFDEVPEAYAREGGEDDRTLETWRPMYWEYIVSECQRIGRDPHEKAPLVMERFAVVYPEAPHKV